MNNEFLVQLQAEKEVSQRIFTFEEINFVLNKLFSMALVPPMFIQDNMPKLRYLFDYCLFHILCYKTIEDKKEIIFNSFPISLLQEVVIKFQATQYVVNFIHLIGHMFRVLFFRFGKNLNKLSLVGTLDLCFSQNDLVQYFVQAQNIQNNQSTSLFPHPE